MTTREQRARGALWGQAVGDALGTTVEFQDQLGIATRAPSAWPRELIGEGPFGLLPGQVTDDTELALCLARSLARCGRYDEEDVAAAYARWRSSGPFDCGQATDQAFGRSLELGPGLAARMRARASRKTQANGSLMRSSPLGIFGSAIPREELARLASADSTLSHPDPVCQAACAVYVTTIADAIATGLSGAELHARALSFAAASAACGTISPRGASSPIFPRGASSPIFPRGASSPIFPRGASSPLDGEELPVSDGENQGWVRIALQHAFFHLKHSTDFEAALVMTVAMGGDTDTNGAIVGALLGATLGVEAIPKRWRDAVRDCLPQRPPEYRCADLEELSKNLLR